MTVAIVGVMALARSIAQPIGYTLTEIVPGNPSVASDARYINDSGEVVGSIGSGSSRRAMYWSPVTGTSSLGVLPNTTSSASGVVASDGTVFGYSFFSSPPYNSATFWWTVSEGMQGMGLPGCRVDDIAADGTFVGASGNLA